MALLPIQFVSGALAQAGIVLIPAYLYAVIKRSRPVAKAASITLLLYVLQSLILSAPSFGVFAGLQYNWCQKIAVIAGIALAAVLLKLSKSDCGFGWPDSKKSYAIALLLGALCTIIPLYFDWVSGESSTTSPEKFLFELTLPGLHEEPFYRGLLLCIWDQAIGRPFKFAGVNFGWGAVVTSLLFILGHVCMFDKNFQLVFEPQPAAWIDLLLFSIAMVWLRYRYTSVWPAVVAHNFSNVLEVLLSPMLRH